MLANAVVAHAGVFGLTRHCDILFSMPQGSTSSADSTTTGKPSDAGDPSTNVDALTTAKEKQQAERGGVRYVSKRHWPEYCALLGAVFESARAPLSLPATRWYFVEEQLFGAVCGVIGGWGPDPGASCVATGYALLAVAVAHLAFLAVTRPYDVWVDLAFAVANGAGVAAAAGAAAWGADAAVMEALLWAQTGIFLLQPLVICGYALTVKLRSRRDARARLQPSAPHRQGTTDGHGVNYDDADALLTVPGPEAAGGVDATANPLLRARTGAAS